MKDPTDDKYQIRTSEYCRDYGILKFDYKNGYFIYEGRRPIRTRKLSPTFYFLFILFYDPGKELEYISLFSFLKLPYATKRQYRDSREKVKHIAKRIRESLGINTLKNPTLDPFVISASGISLALLK